MLIFNTGRIDGTELFFKVNTPLQLGGVVGHDDAFFKKYLSKWNSGKLKKLELLRFSMKRN